MRRLVLAGLLLLLGGAVAAVLLLDRIELAGPVAGRASAALGRSVTLGSLRLALSGGWLRVELRDAALANAEGGSEPLMAEVAAARAELRLADLLLGRAPTLRGVAAEGVSLLLEHGTGPGRDRPNWRFGEAPPATGPPDRAGLPHALDIALRDAALVFRTSTGTRLRIRVEEGQVTAPGPEAEVTLSARGSYNQVPLAIASTSAPVAVLRQAATPYPVALEIASGPTRLGFTGTMTDPLNMDGAMGTLSLAAPTLATLLTLAGAEFGLNAGLEVSGAFTRQGDAWRLRDASGSLAGSPLRIAAAGLDEGGRGEPDRIAVEAALERLNLNRVLGESAAAEETDADMPLDLDPRQDPLLRARLSIGSLTYARMQATGLEIAGTLGPGLIEVETLRLATAGAHVSASLRAARRPGGGARIDAEAAMTESDLETMRRVVGLRALPLGGRVDGRVVVAAEGATLNQAAREARVSAVLALRQGSIAEEVIEMASTDLRLLFRTPRGRTPMRCLLAVLSMEGGQGQVAPLRIRAATGTIAGIASFDLRRRQMDVVVGSQRDSTDFWALDVPMRIWGPFDSPAIRPAAWSAEGRRRLAEAEQMAPLPPDLRSFARRNACAR